MALKQIRLELARTREYPTGSAKHGYEFVAPLDAEGHLNLAELQDVGQACIVHRFWGDDEDETGQLVHHGAGWAFSYEPGEDDDEPIFRFDKHVFTQGEYVSVTEHDGVTRPFRVTWVRTPTVLQKAY